MLASVPIRWRLTLAFVVAMTIVLGAMLFFIYDRTASDADAEIDGQLGVDVTAAVAAVRDDGDDLGDPVHDPIQQLSPDGFVQVIGPNSTVVGATDGVVDSLPVLPRERILELSRGELDNIDVPAPEGEDGSYRLVAQRTQDDGVRYYVVAGTSLADRDETLSSLRRMLLIGGPLALLISALIAYRAIGAALRPVEAMRGRAAAITESDPGQRLPVPPADDEIADLGRTLNEMLDRLESAIERERRFVADASHELRTPLSILRTEVDLALATGRDPSELRAALESAGEEVDRLSRLAEDLLLIARADSGRLPVRLERFDAAELAGRVLDRLPAERTRPRLEVEVGMKLEGDPLRLEQVLGNLLDNAERYAGGAELVQVRSESGAASIHVLDRGEGFPSDLEGRAFHRFAQADADRASGGAGLGLAIVELIARAHGGSAGVEAREGGGSDVWIEWPAEPAPSGADVPAPA